MKSLTVAVALALTVPALTHAESTPLTYMKVAYAAQTCATTEGFITWLKGKKGVTHVSTPYFFKITHPAQTRVLVVLNGHAQWVDIRPDLGAGVVLSKERRDQRAMEAFAKHRRGLIHVSDEPADPDQESRERIKLEVAMLDKMLRDLEAPPNHKKH